MSDGRHNLDCAIRIGAPLNVHRIKQGGIRIRLDAEKCGAAMSHEIAVHEASHAAIYLMAGRANAQITELHVGDGDGHCRVRHRGQFPHAVIAGHVGELRVLEGAEWRPMPEDFSASMHLTDIADAAALVGVEALPQLWRETVSLVDRAWDRIQAIAAALQKAGTLSGKEVELIWRGAEVVWPSR